MSTVPSLRRVIPVGNVDEIREARKELLKRLSTKELAHVAALFGQARWTRADCYKYIMKALDDIAGDSLRKMVQELQGSRCKQLVDVLISVAEYEKKSRDGLLDRSKSIEIPEIYLPQDIPNEAVPYSGNINEEQGSWTLVSPWDSSQKLTFYSQETEKTRLQSRQMLEKLTYEPLSTLLNCLLSYIEPRLRQVYSYKRGMVPNWWPRTIKFNGKNHYSKAAIVELIIYIIFDLHSEGFRIIHAIDAIKFHPKLTVKAKEIVYSILFVRQAEDLCRGNTSNTVPKAEVVIGRRVAQRAPTDSETESTFIRQCSGESQPSIFTRGTLKRSYYILLGVNDQGNIFQSVSQSINRDNLRLSAAVDSFRQEVSRVEEQQRAYLLQVHNESEQKG
ncbi:hypothetical protein BDV27DRAFT_163461 [Aspergillus caelatus]|uniref:Subtelomeric hrmA-associated cluster protein AFUB-079030/YDR124W-like helical bundle domain-containing protein n=1 Tax=Aspergillus caelatus TaxID=61420 RepID=A0A5N6ZLT7_9EURO|nr:uncharacterized protein BDV27DRAFT_163461 [Aspergillus caelatus]KAE8358567.1 hypothetical protein BDV27DRAFT_163461 [Aspergillus caelatus]